MEQLSTAIFALAIGHVFLTGLFRRAASRYPEGSVLENLLHLLGEVEIVFGLWAAIFLGIWAVAEGTPRPLHHLDSTNFSEAVFVFVIMTISATKPVLEFARAIVTKLATGLPTAEPVSLTITVLIAGPLLGSLITEPAAMTLSALLLLPIFTAEQLSERGRYLLLGILFVNVSIGGTLTHFASPPVLMVARPWQWDSVYLLTHFGWRAACAVALSAFGAGIFLRRELRQITLPRQSLESSPVWVTIIHLLFLAFAVVSAHHIPVLIGISLFFLGWTKVSAEYQSPMDLRSGILVGFFLAGLVVLGRLQGWWIQPFISDASPRMLFWGATALTAVVDNALLTYLGTLVSTLTEEQKLLLVRGAVCGGGLTVIANAPNPAGYTLLRSTFSDESISAAKLFLGASVPTLIAAILFLL